MKTQEALLMFSDLLDGYFFHPRFCEEMSELLRKELKGKEKRFFNCLAVQLTYIKEFGVEINNVDGHEIIRGLKNHFYSIHIQQSQFNVRFLTHISSDGTVLFLCAFYERSGHKHTDYSTYIEALETRYKEMKDEAKKNGND